MSLKNNSFYFDGVYVVDPLHYQMLKELYAEQLSGTELDALFEEKRSVFASLIVRLSENEDCPIGDDALMAIATGVEFDRLLPDEFSMMGSPERRAILFGLNALFDRVIDSWVAPPVSPKVEQSVRRVIGLFDGVQ